MGRANRPPLGTTEMQWSGVERDHKRDGTLEESRSRTAAALYFSSNTCGFETRFTLRDRFRLEFDFSKFSIVSVIQFECETVN